MRGRCIDRDEAVRLYGQSLPIREIAERLACTPQAVRAALDAHGIERPRNPKKGRRIDREKVLKLYEACQSGPEVARQIGCPPYRVYLILEAHGIARNGHQQKRSPAREAAKRVVAGPPRHVVPEPVAAQPVAPKPVPIRKRRQEPPCAPAMVDKPVTYPLGLTADRIARLIASGGAYRALAALAIEWEQPLSRVQSWYHRARAAA